MVSLNGNSILHSSLEAAIFYFLLIAGNIKGDGSSEKYLMSATVSTSTSTQNTQVPMTFPSSNSSTKAKVISINDLTSVNFTKVCLDSLSSFISYTVVAGNMEKGEANSLFSRRRKLAELSRNLTENVMNAAENIQQIKALFALNKTPQSINQMREEEDSVTIPILLLVILCLLTYIGFLSYKIKTTYYRRSTILIEDNM